MSLRIRADGRVLCAAMHGPEPGDTYIDDGLHYILSIGRRVLVTEEMDSPSGRGGHHVHGQWWWSGGVPADVVVASFYRAGPLPCPVCGQGPTARAQDARAGEGKP